MAKITDAERNQVRDHLHAACEILDKHSDLHWTQDPLLRIAHFITLANADAVQQSIYMILALAPDEQVQAKFAEILARPASEAEARAS
jgi:hypothetical protein